MRKHRTSINHPDGENHSDDLSLNGHSVTGMRQFSDYEAEIDSYLKDTNMESFRKTLIAVNAKFIKEEINQPKRIIFKPKMYRRAYIYAVAATIAILLGIYGITKVVVNSSDVNYNGLFALYYQPYQSDYILRSDQITINNLYLAFQAYENHDYNKAVELFTKVVNADETMIIAYFYKGVSCIETNNLPAAIESFNKVLVNETNPYYPQAQWYMALSMLKLDNPQAAKQHLNWLVANDRFYGKKAREVLDKLAQ